MIVCETINEVRQHVKAWKAEGKTIGLVPTMGALHEGHASLIDMAKDGCDKVIASVFVNPIQFAQNEDLDKYPRNFEKDCKVLKEHGCDLVFHPNVEEMYPEGFCAIVDLESEMTKQLCGKSRATHFKGVCTVVSKLFNIVSPHKAYFGEKDAQQLAVIKQMVRDLAFDIEVIGCPTVREENGLAKSSRNAYLSETEKKAATVLYKAIKEAQGVIKSAVLQNEEIMSNDVIQIMTEVINEDPEVKIEYIEAVDGRTLMPVEKVEKGVLVALAAVVGTTRLIDNFTVS